MQSPPLQTSSPPSLPHARRPTRKRLMILISQS
jgi:hypothetical protein